MPWMMIATRSACMDVDPPAQLRKAPPVTVTAQYPLRTAIVILLLYLLPDPSLALEAQICTNNTYDEPASWCLLRRTIGDRVSPTARFLHCSHIGAAEVTICHGRISSITSTRKWMPGLAPPRQHSWNASRPTTADRSRPMTTGESDALDLGRTQGRQLWKLHSPGCWWPSLRRTMPMR